MSQATLGTIDPDDTSGTDLATLLNNWEAALLSSHKGGTAPTYAIAGTVWIDDSGTYWVLKRYDGTAWIVEGFYDTTNHIWFPVGPSGAATIASASTVDLWSTPHAVISISGNTDVTQLNAGNSLSGQSKKVRITGSPKLKYDGTKLLTPTAADIQTAAGDTFEVQSLGGNNALIFNYQRANGRALADANKVTGVRTATASGNFLLADSGGWVRYNSSSPGTLTIRAQATDAWEDLVMISGQQVGTGQLTLAAGAGVTFSNAALKIAAQGGGFTLVRTASDTWDVAGLLTT